MKRSKNQYMRLFAAVLLACILLSSCTFITVVNDSKGDIQLKMITPPFLGSKVALLHPGDEKFALGATGGDFRISVIAGKEVYDAMTALKDKLSADLKKPNLDPTEVLTILDQLDTVRNLINAAGAALSTDYCGGTVTDFGSVNATVVTAQDGTVKFDECVVNPPSVEDLFP